MAKFKPYKFDPIADLDLDIPKSKRKEALEAAAEFIKEAMLSYIGEAKSPTSKGKWVRGLTKEYADKKAEESSTGFANLELSGEFLDSLTAKVSKNKIVLDVGQDQYGKAEGHITGQYGKKSRIRPRQFMPQGNETFKRDILSDLKDILKDYEDGENKD